MAFTSTLDVLVEADLLIHVVDASAPDPEGCVEAVRDVLTEIGAGGVPELYVYNKADLAPAAAARLARDETDSVVVSARTGEGIEVLLDAVASILRRSTRVVELDVPFDRGDVRAMAHREGQVVDETIGDRSWHLRVRVDEGSAGRLDKFRVVPDADRSEPLAPKADG